MVREDLFSTESAAGAEAPERPETRRHQPLAARMRPRDLNEFAGQSHILGPGQLLRRAIEADRVQSLIFYGPPGTGKRRWRKSSPGKPRASSNGSAGWNPTWRGCGECSLRRPIGWRTRGNPRSRSMTESTRLITR